MRSCRRRDVFVGFLFPQWLIGGLGWWFGFLESPYEGSCYLGVALESQTTNPNHQFAIMHNDVKKHHGADPAHFLSGLRGIGIQIGEASQIKV